MSTKKVLITGARAPTSIEITRMYYKMGWVVHMVDSTMHAVGAASTCVSKFHLSLSPRFQTKGYIEMLRHIVEKEGIQRIVPTCEETFYISRYRDELPAEVFVDSFEKLSLLHNKGTFAAITKHTSLPAPDTTIIHTQKELEEYLSSCSSSVICKPVHSRFSAYMHVWHRGERIPLLPQEQFSYVVQNFVRGGQWCTYSLAENGKVTAHVAYQTKYRTGQGATVHFRAEQKPELEQFVREICEHLSFTGQIAFDFIEGDRMYPVECNPRTTSGVHLLSKEVWKGVVAPIETQDAQISLLMLGAMKNVRSWAEWKEWAKCFTSARDVLWDKKDPKPFWKQFSSFFYWKQVAKEYGIPLLAAPTYDIEWNGEEL